MDLIFDWTNPEELPIPIKDSLEFFMESVLCLDANDVVPTFHKKDLTIEYDGFIIKVPKKLRDKIKER